jgi:hypothetical protein
MSFPIFVMYVFSSGLSYKRLQMHAECFDARLCVVNLVAQIEYYQQGYLTVSIIADCLWLARM